MFGKKSKSSYRLLPILLWSILFGILFVLSVGLFVIGDWYRETYDLEFKELLYTLASPLKGTGEGTLEDLKTSEVQPTVVLDDLRALLNAILCAEEAES